MKSLQELLQPQTVDSDATMVEVFGEKSQAADNSLGRIAKDVYGLASEIDPLSATHAGLAGAGMIPAIGNVADLIDAGIYGLEGKGGDGALSLAAAIPLAGIASRGAQVAGKFTKKVLPDIAKPSVVDEMSMKFLKSKGHDPQGIVSGELTRFGKFLEGRSKKKLYKKLATKAEYEKFKNTYPNLTVSNEGFDVYKTWLNMSEEALLS